MYMQILAGNKYIRYMSIEDVQNVTPADQELVNCCIISWGVIWQVLDLLHMVGLIISEIQHLKAI